MCWYAIYMDFSENVSSRNRARSRGIVHKNARIVPEFLNFLKITLLKISFHCLSLPLPVISLTKNFTTNHWLSEFFLPHSCNLAYITIFCLILSCQCTTPLPHLSNSADDCYRKWWTSQIKRLQIFVKEQYNQKAKTKHGKETLQGNKQLLAACSKCPNKII